MNVRWCEARGSTYQRISFRRTRLTGAARYPRTCPRRVGGFSNGRSAVTAQALSAWALDGSGAWRPPPVLRAPGSAGRLRTSSLSREKIAATSPSAWSGMRLVYCPLCRDQRAASGRLGQHGKADLGAQLSRIRLTVVGR